MLEGVASREEGVNTFSASLKQPPLTKPSQRYHAITLEIRCHPPKKTLYSDSLVQLSVYSCGASSIYAFSCQIPVTLDVVMVGLCSDVTDLQYQWRCAIFLVLAAVVVVVVGKTNTSCLFFPIYCPLALPIVITGAACLRFCRSK